MIFATKELNAFITHLSSLIQSNGMHLSQGCLTEASVMEMAVNNTVFQEFLKINSHAHMVDTRQSFFSLVLVSRTRLTTRMHALCKVKMPP